MRSRELEALPRRVFADPIERPDAGQNEATCVDLDAVYGDRFRLGWEADGATRNLWPREDWSWLRELRCRHGRVYPVGGDMLAAVTDRPRLGARLRRLPCVLTARGDLETVVTFRLADAGAVLALLRPYRRRRVTPAERARLAAIGDASKFGRRHGVQSGFAAVESINGGL
jgi:hypothetical protein